MTKNIKAAAQELYDANEAWLAYEREMENPCPDAIYRRTLREYAAKLSKAAKKKADAK